MKRSRRFFAVNTSKENNECKSIGALSKSCPFCMKSKNVLQFSDFGLKNHQNCIFMQTTFCQQKVLPSIEFVVNLNFEILCQLYHQESKVLLQLRGITIFKCSSKVLLFMQRTLTNKVYPVPRIRCPYFTFHEFVIYHFQFSCIYLKFGTKLIIFHSICPW